MYEEIKNVIKKVNPVEIVAPSKSYLGINKNDAKVLINRENRSGAENFHELLCIFNDSNSTHPNIAQIQEGNKKITNVMPEYSNFFEFIISSGNKYMNATWEINMHEGIPIINKVETMPLES